MQKNSSPMDKTWVRPEKTREQVRENVPSASNLSPTPVGNGHME